MFLRTLIDSGVPRYQNVSREGNERITDSPVAEFQERREEVNWEDFRWLREFWPRKLFIKGVVRGDERRKKAQQLGADGVFISNHGGTATRRRSSRRWTLSQKSAPPPAKISW